MIAVALSGCGAGASGPARPSAGRWLSSDAPRRAATVTLIAGYDRADNGRNLDGYVKGALLFAVPRGWTVTLRCINHSRTARYACAVLDGPGTRGPAFPAAAVPHPAAGLEFGRASAVRFVARRTGDYRVYGFAGGREQAGMWAVLDVVRSGRPRAERLR